MFSKTGMDGPGFSRFIDLMKLFATLLVAAVAAGFSGDLHAGDMFKGRQLYNSHCAVCHGAGGQATMPGAPSFARQERIIKPDFTLLASIRTGKNAMPAFQGILTDRDILDVIAYIRTMN
ncbi:c-type cytochrome [Noviherbaspirillum denitrificans]|nr:cytochrome c [Noviherbaspirillum denitrificans]